MKRIISCILCFVMLSQLFVTATAVQMNTYSAEKITGMAYVLDKLGIVETADFEKEVRIYADKIGEKNG